MAYFSNGTEGEIWQAEHCEHCVNWQGDPVGCPVWDVHLLYNYDQCPDTLVGQRVQAILDYLIPRSEDKLSNQTCSMFRKGG